MTASHLFLACLLLAFTSLISATPVGDSVSKPNIIFVVADDMGFKDTGHSGKAISRPNIRKKSSACLRNSPLGAKA